jgi:drug/metabolite transporter (DMT)-like permease
MVGLATVAEPVGATAIAAAWLGEIPDAQTLVGSAIILVAVGASLPRRQRPPSG